MTERVSKPARTSPEVILSFTQNVFTPRQSDDPNRKPTRGCTIMLPKDGPGVGQYLKDLHSDLLECLKEAFPDKYETLKGTLVGGTYSPIKDGDKTVRQDSTLHKDKYPELEGHWFIRASTSNPLPVVDQNNQFIIDPNEIYGGVKARVSLNAYSYHGKKKQGVTLGLNGIQKVGEGTRFGGGGPAVDEMFDASGADDPLNYQEPASGTGDFFADARAVDDTDDIPF
jgi:hypothetical protein